MVYHLWKKRVSNIVAEVGNLRVEYDRKRLPKWDFIQRSILSEKITKRQNKVTELSEEGRIMNVLVDYKQPEAVLRRLATLGPVKRHGIEVEYGLYPPLEMSVVFVSSLDIFIDIAQGENAVVYVWSNARLAIWTNDKIYVYEVPWI